MEKEEIMKQFKSGMLYMNEQPVELGDGRWFFTDATPIWLAKLFILIKTHPKVNILNCAIGEDNKRAVYFFELNTNTRFKTPQGVWKIWEALQAKRQSHFYDAARYAYTMDDLFSGYKWGFNPGGPVG